ncbi:MAG: hydrogenase maturation protease [Alphaproteobacteria bacterium]|nr:hydrogenase maturation protease [Alphaproteobacteria bacterium]
MAALLIGFGNQGRGDDGLGPVFAERIEKLAPKGLAIDIDYQLTVDHAPMVAEADLVIFADAEIGAAGSFSFTEVKAEGAVGMGSHELSPQAVMTLAKTLYGREPPAYVLGISGWDYGEVKEGLSAEAEAHLEAAETFFVDWYASREPAANA